MPIREEYKIPIRNQKTIDKNIFNLFAFALFQQHIICIIQSAPETNSSVFRSCSEKELECKKLSLKKLFVGNQKVASVRE